LSKKPIHVGDEHDVMIELLENNTLLNLDFKPMDNPIDIVLPKERSRYKSTRRDRVFMWGAIIMGGLVTIFTYGSYIIGVNNIKAIANMNGMKMTFYVLAFSCFLFFTNIVVKGGEFAPLVTFDHWWNILALAFIPTLISDLTLIYAIQLIGSTITAILGCMEPLTAAIVGVLVFHEKISPVQGIGMILVFAAVTFVILAQKKTNK
jgi:drug/metabolite transporter (DMT)-like permease